MRILFVLPLTGLLRHFESVVVMLADRGHTVGIATPGKRNDWPLPQAITSHPNIQRLVCPEAREDQWRQAATDFRLMVDCGRYLGKPFAGADKLRARAFQTFVRAMTNGEKRHLVSRCPSCHVRLVDDEVGKLQPSIGDSGAARIKELARVIEQSIPSDPGRERFLTEQEPDMLLVSPLVGLGSEQADWVKSARALGIPVGFPVFSWDNLTTKGLIHVLPDQVFVWNDIQKQEAIDHHGVPAERIVVTGAPRFDAFFDLKPSSDRQQFCGKFGFDSSSPIVTYLCSSDFVAGREVDFIRQWIADIRQAPELADCSVLIRPHPRSVKQWTDVDVSQWGRTGLAMSRRLNADQLLYDTLHYSSAVVGLNTSAQLEAGILGKPVYTLLAPGFERGQQGTLHFRYLLAEEGGFVAVANDVAEHRRQLADGVAGRFNAQQMARFLEGFIRPAGWQQPATPLLADAIERLVPEPRSTVKRWLTSASRALRG
jgi:hypothetical protein